MRKRTITLIIGLILIASALVTIIVIRNNKIKEQEKEMNNKIYKIYYNKDFVFDASYDRNIKEPSYETYYSTYYAKDIIVPYINVNSQYAKESNDEIKEIYNNLINYYNQGVDDKTSYVKDCNYIKYNKNDVLSILFSYGYGATDYVNPEYHTYNLDLKTGKKLSYKEIYTIAGFNSDNIEFAVENAISRAVSEKVEGDFENFNSSSFENYKESINDNSLKYYLSEEGKLNIVVVLNLPFGTGNFNTIITVE